MVVIRSSHRARLSLVLPRAMFTASGSLPGPAPLSCPKLAGGCGSHCARGELTAVPAPACTGLSAVVNHCSNVLPGEWAVEEDVIGRATSARSPHSSPAGQGPELFSRALRWAETTSPNSLLSASKNASLSISSLGQRALKAVQWHSWEDRHRRPDAWSEQQLCP